MFWFVWFLAFRLSETPPLTFNLKTLTQNLPLYQILPIFVPRNVNFRRFYISGFRNNL